MEDPKAINLLKDDHVLTIKVNRRIRRTHGRSWHCYDFKIHENSGRGDCLFITLADFIKALPTSASFVQPFHHSLRKKIVSHITSPDQDDPKKFSTWMRYKQAIKFTLDKHLPFFKNFAIDNKDPSIEAEAREIYKNYMKQSGVYGTYVEVCAAMEIYAFNTTLIEKGGGIGDRFYVCHLDLEQPFSQAKDRRLFLLFTGTLDQGHFELLEPLSQRAPTLPKGIYQVTEADDSTRCLSLIQSEDSSTSFQSSSPINHSMSPKQRKLKRSHESPKRLKIEQHKAHDTDPEIPSNRGLLAPFTLLFQHELNILHSLYIEELESIRCTLEAMTSDSTQAEIWPGVKNSDILTFGKFRTAFLHFGPRSSTPLAPTTDIVTCMVYDSALLKIMQFDEDEKLLGSSTKTGEFTLEKGYLYVLENPSNSKIMLRTIWLDK